MALHQRLSTQQQAGGFGAGRPCPCIHSIASPALPPRRCAAEMSCRYISNHAMTLPSPIERRLPFTPSSTPPQSSSSSYGSNSSSGSSRRQLVRAADAGSLSGAMPDEPFFHEKPFPRLRERDPYRSGTAPPHQHQPTRAGPVVQLLTAGCVLYPQALRCGTGSIL
jgi:hypothetical protein